MVSMPQHLSATANTGPHCDLVSQLLHRQVCHVPNVEVAANRLQGANLHDFTSHMPSQVSWTIENMPDINFQWKPTGANITVGEVGCKPYLMFGKRLRDFDVLPDRISSNVEPWLLQAWFRLDCRIIWKDITDRIELSARPKWNTINMDCVRQREDSFMRPWSSSKGVNTHARDDVFESILRGAGIDPNNNTTRGLTPGLVDPTAGPNTARVAVPERWANPRKQRKADSNTSAAKIDDNQQATSPSGAILNDNHQASASSADSLDHNHQASGLSRPRASTNEKGRASRRERAQVGEPKVRMLQRGKIVTTEKMGHGEEERPRKKQRVQFKAVKDLRSVRAAEDPFASAGIESRVDESIQTEEKSFDLTTKEPTSLQYEIWVAEHAQEAYEEYVSDSRIKHLTYEIWLQREGRKQFDLHVQSLLSVTPGSFPQRISTSVRALSLPKDTQANTSSSFSVVEPSDEPNAFINSALSYLHSCPHGSQYPNLELALSNTVSP